MLSCRFASAWLEIKERSQTAYAEAVEDICELPAVIGPCKLRVGRKAIYLNMSLHSIRHFGILLTVSSRFFFNPDTGDCEPFGYGGCEGNENNFVSLLKCSE